MENKPQKFWVITDTHFGHKNIHEYCGRPVGFEQLILDNVRKVVQPDDVLIHTGDFCFGRDAYWHEEFMSACAGKRWLVRGNHDKKKAAWYLRNGWDFIAKRIEFNIYGHRVIFSHKPINELGSFVNIHGHYHNNGVRLDPWVDDRHLLIHSEHEYRPFCLEKLIKEKFKGVKNVKD